MRFFKVLLLMLATLKTSGVASAPGTASWATSAFTPSAGSLIVAVLHVRDTGGSGDIAANLTISDGTNSYTARVTQGMAGGAKMQGRIWTAPEVTGGSRTITFDCGASSVGAALWFIYEVTGYNTSNPVGGSASNAATFPIDGAASLTLSSVPLPTSIVLSSCGVDGDVTGTIAVTPGAGWTEDGEVGNTTVQSYAQSQQRTNSSSTSVDWVDVRAGTMATFSSVGLALEIQSGDMTGPTAIVDKPLTLMRCRPLGPGNPLREVKYYDTPSAAAGISDSVDETLSSADSEVVTAAFVVSETETLTAADSETAVAVFPVSRTESLTAADSQSATETTAGAVAESLSATDSQTGGLSVTGADTESLTAADTQTGVIAQSGARAETLTAADSETGLLTAVGLETETLSAADAVSTLLTGVGSRTETLAVSDALIASVISAASVSESLSATDSSTGVIVSLASFTFHFAGGPVMTATITAGGVLIASVRGGPTLTSSMSGGPA